MEDVTGSEILKLNLGNMGAKGNDKIRDEDIAYQMLFSLRNETIIDQKCRAEGNSEFNDCSVNGNDCFSNLARASAAGASGTFDGFSTGSANINLNGSDISLRLQPQMECVVECGSLGGENDAALFGI